MKIKPIILYCLNCGKPRETKTILRKDTLTGKYKKEIYCKVCRTFLKETSL